MTTFYIILTASPTIFLGFVAFTVFIAVGVRRGDSKRLTGNPKNSLERLARRVLTGSRGLDDNDESED
jgi:hypothetical protein